MEGFCFTLINRNTRRFSILVPFNFSWLPEKVFSPTKPNRPLFEFTPIPGELPLIGTSSGFHQLNFTTIALLRV
jgi:hypothetical protein